MKKLATVFLITALLVFCFAGCKNDNGATETSDMTSVEESVTEVSEESFFADDGLEYSSADGLPPCNEELRGFYSDATELLSQIMFEQLELDYENPIMKWNADYAISLTYYPVTDSRFSTLEDFTAECGKYFTKEFFDEQIMYTGNPMPKFGNIDSKLYCTPSGRGGRMDYNGHVFGKVIYGEDTIKMPVTLYFNLVEMPDEIFYEVPDDIENYETEDYTFEIVKTENGWRFSTIRVIGY